MRRPLPWLLGAAGLLVVALVVAIEAGAEEVERGGLVDYTEQEAVRYRLWDRFEVLAAPETRLEPDSANALALAAACGVALLTALTLWPRGRSRDRTFFLAAAVGAGALALDELYELNETVALNLGSLPLVSPRNLDLVYLLLAVAFVGLFWRVMLSSRRALGLWLAGAAVFVAATLSDVTGIAAGVEERLEPVATLFFVGGLAALGVERTRAAAAVEDDVAPAAVPAGRHAS